MHLLLKGITISNHSDGKKTITPNSFLLVDSHNSKLMCATRGMKECFWSEYTLDGSTLKYDFKVNNSFGDYEGKAEGVWQDSTEWSSRVFIMNYETSRGSNGVVYYDDMFEVKNEFMMFENMMKERGVDSFDWWELMNSIYSGIKSQKLLDNNIEFNRKLFAKSQIGCS